MDALFACTKCHTRHPFEELSKGEQLCKRCRNNYPVVKCTYCRSEYQQEENSRSICKKCNMNIKAYGKPSACEYCNVIAAFIGKRCQRCSNSEKKWGEPVSCDQCKQNCAFERDEESRRKVDGKVMCWLCTMSYKRVLAKAKQKSENAFLSSGNERSSEYKNKKHRSMESHRSNSAKDGERDRKREKARSGHGEQKDQVEGGAAAKKSRLDKATSNGLATSSPLGSKPGSDASLLDTMANTENLIVITQLKDEIEQLKKQLSQKDQQLLEKDKQLTLLKAKNFESEKDLRKKMDTLQKVNDEAIEKLQMKNRDMQKQLAALSKLTKKGSSANLTALALSDTNSPSI